jgi:hypothetical protein
MRRMRLLLLPLLLALLLLLVLSVGHVGREEPVCECVVERRL